jgi:hypothetical protein
VTIRIDNVSRLRGGGAQRGIIQSTIPLAFAGAAALVASATNADASAPEINSAWSYSFVDSLPTNDGLERRRTLSPRGADWALRCFANCGLAFATNVVRRSDLLTSNDADVSGKRVVDATGRAMGVSGMVVIERLEPDGFGADWLVVGEQTLDGNGTHSWSLLSSGISLDAPWRPGDLYQFEGSSFSMDFAAASPTGAGATPEPSTWAMILIGFAGLGLAAYRSSRNNQRSIHFPNVIYAR